MRPRTQPSPKAPPARIEATGDHRQERCCWCETVHRLDEPHAEMPPGARYDPTLWSKSRDDENHEPTVGRWFRVTTADLVDPSGYPVNEWQALETLAWLCRGAARLEFEAYHEQTV